METNARANDKKYIDELERKLVYCCEKIGYLQDQLNLRTVEAGCMGEQVHSLELKLAEVEKLNKKLRLMNEELEKSNLKCLILTREIKQREKELQSSSLRVEKLEEAISSITLEYQCEIESIKLDMTALEQKCFEAEKFSQKAAEDKIRIQTLLEESKFKFEVAQERISYLEKETKERKEKVLMPDTNSEGLSCKVEHLDSSPTLMSKMNYFPSDYYQDLMVKLREELTYLKEMCTCEEVLGPFLSKLAIVTAWDDDTKKKMKTMSSQILENELVIKRLKEELREEKHKAREEAEDLIQAMAELRYQTTSMLDEECKRRACVEQASLHRIQELVVEVETEQKKSKAACELAEILSVEISHLKHTLEGTSMERERPEGSNDICDGSIGQLALIKWSSEAPAVEGEENCV